MRCLKRSRYAALATALLVVSAVPATAISIDIVAERGPLVFAFDVVWGATPTSSSAFAFGEGSTVSVSDNVSAVTVSSSYGDPYPTLPHILVVDFGSSGDSGRSFEAGDLVGASGVRVFPLSRTAYGARFLYPIGVPDDGSPAVLLGAGLFGMCLFRRWIDRRGLGSFPFVIV
jgi:hypothetical protein